MTPVLQYPDQGRSRCVCRRCRDCRQNLIISTVVNQRRRRQIACLFLIYFAIGQFLLLNVLLKIRVETGSLRNEFADDDVFLETI